MDLYLDLSIILTIIIILLLPIYFKFLLDTRFLFIEVLGLVILFVIEYFNIYIFSNYYYLNLLFTILYFVFIYKKKFFKYLFSFILVYYGNISVLRLFLKDIYLYYFVLGLAKEVFFKSVVIICMNIFIVFLISFSIRKIKLLSNYRKEIYLVIEGRKVKLLGYVDSGNTLVIEGLPVVIVSEYYFRFKKYKLGVINGIGKDIYKYQKTLIRIDGTIKEVIVASKGNKSFNGCECLLNIYLLEERK